MNEINFKMFFSATMLGLSFTIVSETQAQGQAKATDIVIPQIKRHYCVSFENNGEKTLQQMAQTLLNFKSYPAFDGEGAKYSIFGFYITPFDLVATKEVMELRRENFAINWPQFNVTTSAKFAIQPTPMWDVDAQFYPKLKLDCQTTLVPKNNSGIEFTYRCQLDQSYEKNYGLNRFDTEMFAESPSQKCQGQQSYLEIVGDMTVDGDDFSDLKQGVIQKMPVVIQTVGIEFIDAFFDPPKLFTNFYDSFYGGWVTQSGFAIHRSW